MPKIKWRLQRKGPNAYEGVIEIPKLLRSVTLPSVARPTATRRRRLMPPKRLQAGRGLRVRARATSKANALAKAASVADAIASNPVLASVMPPGTAVALKATKYLANSAAAGKLGKALGNVAGKGARRLGKVLGKLF